MAKTKISFELNQKLYNQMNEVCEEIGLTPQEAFEIFARKVVNEQGIPFEISKKDFPVDERQLLIDRLFQAAGIVALIGAAGSLISAVFHLRKGKR